MFCVWFDAQVTHNTDAVVAALSFWAQLDRIRQLRARATPPPAAATLGATAACPAPNTAPSAQLDPNVPASLAERAKQAFANHNLPVTKKLSVPSTSVHLSCPGG
jgi:hypothetical protein